MASVNEDEIEKAGLNPADVKRIVDGLSRYGKQAEKLGITVYGGSGSGMLRFKDCKDKGPLIVGELDGDFDGGDGQTEDYGDELMRGEG